MITSATERPRCSLLSTCWTARSSAVTCSATGTRSSSASSTPSRRRCQRESRSMLSSTTTPPTNTPRCANGSRHPRWTFHFTPTSASWLNAVEGFFAKLTRRRLKRGVFRSVVDLQAAINRFIEENNADPKPFIWTANPNKIICRRQPWARSVRFDPLVTPRVARHRVFVWSVIRMLPDTRLVAIARDDDASMGLLHSRFHEAWSLRLGGRHGVGNDPQYTPTLGFETFPFPEGLTPNIPATAYANDPRAITIAKAAKRLDELRNAWLNPPDLIDIVPEVVPGYPDRILPKTEVAAAELEEAHAHQSLQSAPAMALRRAPRSRRRGGCRVRLAGRYFRRGCASQTART